VDEVKAIVGTVVSQRAAAATLNFAFLRVLSAERHADVILRGRMVVLALARVTLTNFRWACVIVPEETLPPTTRSSVAMTAVARGSPPALEAHSSLHSLGDNEEVESSVEPYAALRQSQTLAES
jgi:hypothetical protein